MIGVVEIGRRPIPEHSAPDGNEREQPQKGRTMKTRATVIVAIAAMICLLPLASQALTPYGQDFESMALPSAGALLGDGWLVYGNVFGPDWSWWYGYGTFDAPNDGAAFCAIVAGEGEDAQCLSVYSDYNNADQADGIVDALVFQEQTITAGDVGHTWTFAFDAKLGNLAGSTTADAFIKTLNPNNGYAETNHITLDMTSIPTTWNAYSMTITIDAALEGQILQFGFESFCRNYEGSGVFYDNAQFYYPEDQPVATENKTWGGVKALFR